MKHIEIIIFCRINKNKLKWAGMRNMYLQNPKYVYQLSIFLECKTKGYVLFSMLCVALGSFLLPNQSVTVAAKKGGWQRSKGGAEQGKKDTIWAPDSATGQVVSGDDMCLGHWTHVLVLYPH